ncbi:MAG: AAA family ATPase, partial [Actinomycetota bacterium]|nr:AAA family ATPase [Actinomycetota bacterium]
MANSTGPRAWGLGPDAKLTYLALNVGRLGTIALHPDRVLVGLDETVLDDRVRAQLDEASTRDGGDYASMPTSHYWNLRPDALPVLIDQIRPALERHIENAVGAVSVTPYARFHSGAAIEYLVLATGRNLPNPEYSDFPPIFGKTGWDGFVAWAARIFDEERFDDWERNYKLAIAVRLQKARTALLSSENDWWALLRRAFTKDNNLTPWQHHSTFYQWARDEPDAAQRALREIWNEDADVSDRIRGFTRNLPRDVVSGVGTRLAIASFLLMVEPRTHPIFRSTPFKEAWEITGWDAPPADADEAHLYETALAFMDELRNRLASVGVQTRDRLDAQGLIWGVTHWNEPPEFLTPEEQEQIVRFKKGEVDVVPAEDLTEIDIPQMEGYVEPSFDEILERFAAAGFRIAPDTLLRYHLSLKTRGFVILSGVSGTGKSWLTRLYADAVGGRSLVIPVAPNWTTNEDLLGFHNPVIDKYVDTEFSRFLREAVDEQEDADLRGVAPRPYFLVLDEMNLARVEYYFAKFLSVMEARTQDGVAIEMSASESLPLPANLYAVGTVNVDETTHGFSDKVYDRAQVIALPISADDIVEHIGNAPYSSMLMSVWHAVATVAPFAYRVVDEIAAYVQIATDAGLEWEQALDHEV